MSASAPLRQTTIRYSGMQNVVPNFNLLLYLTIPSNLFLNLRWTISMFPLRLLRNIVPPLTT